MWVKGEGVGGKLGGSGGRQTDIIIYYYNIKMFVVWSVQVSLRVVDDLISGLDAMAIVETIIGLSASM